MSKSIELAIIGSGIAGVSAAVYARRSGLDFVIFEEKGIGGQLLLMENIDNYVGLPLNTKGNDLAKELATTLEDLEIRPINQGITKIKMDEKAAILQAKDCDYKAKSLIIASGASFRRLGVSGETEFLGKGVSYCAVCDGFFFKGKDVAVIGGGNTAVEEALYLSEIANRVTLVHRRDQLRAIEYLQKDLFKKPNIEVLFDSVVKEIKGSELMGEVIIENTKSRREQSLSLQGLFIAIGINPNTDIFADSVSVDKDGFIVTDEHMRTSCEFVWAAGDCRKRPLRQLITAASEGAIATMSVYKYLRGHYISS